MNIILECLLKWFAPILAFTTEEISNLVNPTSESIHLSNFDTLPETWNNPKLKEKWESLYKIKEKVNIAIEEKRTAKEIGSSLEALVEINIVMKQTINYYQNRLAGILNCFKSYTVLG